MISRYVAYYRVSTARQGESGLGLDAQKRAVAAFVGGGAAELVDEFQEVESGKRSDRPALEAAISRCRLTGSRLLIAKLDRLSRDVHFLTGLEKQGIDFVACDMPSANRLTIHIMAAVAQAEREMIAARTRAALSSIKEKLRRGEEHVSRRSGRPVVRLGNPNGIKPSQSQKATAALLQKADEFTSSVSPVIRAFRERQMSLAEIAQHMNGLKVRTSRGCEWTPMAVKRVLDREIQMAMNDKPQ